MSKIIAIDGVASSGKGTITKIVAEKLNLTSIDTGAMYRAIALETINKNVDINDKEKIIEIAKNSTIKLDRDGTTYLNGEDVTKMLKTQEVNSIVSQVSSIPEVREILVEQQRKMAENLDVIMEGRDITTVVFPNTKYKFYLDADLEERTKRRHLQNQQLGLDIPYEKVLESLKFRDENDMNKPVGALKRTDDQVYINTTDMSIDEVVNKIISKIKEIEEMEK